MSQLTERLRSRLGAITVHVPDWNGTGKDPLVDAIRNASPGDVLGIRGRRRAIKIGTGSTTHDDSAWWVAARPISQLAIVSEDDSPERASIGGVIIGDRLGGIDGLTLCGVDLTTTPYAAGKSSKFCLLAENDAQTGALRIWDSAFSPAAGHELDWNGYGMMTGVRTEGLIDGLDLIGIQTWRSQEHGCVYANNLGWRTGKPSTISHVSRNPRSPTGGHGRTEVQIVNRATATPQTTAGPTGKGPLFIESIDAFVEDGGGGYAITVAGHLGAVAIRDIRARCIGPHGGVVVYSDVGHGLHKDEGGFTTSSLSLRNVNVSGGNNAHVALSGIGRALIRAPFEIVGTKTCIDIDNQFGGGVRCGEVGFVGEEFGHVLASYPGFQAGAKVKRNGLAVPASALNAMLLGV